MAGHPRLTNIGVSLGALAVMALLFAVGEVAARRRRGAEDERWRQSQLREIEVYADHWKPCLAQPLGPKRNGVRRVFVVGESSGFMTGEHMAELAPEDRAEVINCAVSGSTLEQVERRIDEALAQAPDDIVLIFGHNLVYLDPAPWQLQLLRLRNESGLVGWLARKLHGNHGFTGLRFARENDRRMVAFERVLRKLSTAARARRIGVTVTTMAGNLWWPPAVPARWDWPVAVAEAAFLEATGRAQDALPVLARFADDHPEEGWAQFHYGLALYRSGRVAEARRRLERALELEVDHGVGRATPEENELIRRVAADEKLRLRDTERVRRAVAPGEVIGWESMSDNCHLLRQAFHEEAQAQLELLGVTPKATAACKPERLAEVLAMKVRTLRVGIEDALATLVWRSLAVAGAEAEPVLDAFAGDLLRIPEPETRARMLAATARGYAWANRLDRALALSQAATSAAPSVEAWIDQGLLLLAHARRGPARAAFERALQLDPDRAEARWLVARLADADRER
jgi:tetratricopeptide (TPR) repeat protein